MPCAGFFNRLRSVCKRAAALPLIAVVKFYQALHLALHAAFVPVYADLFAVCRRGAAQIRARQGRLAHPETAGSLPSVGRQRLRSGAVGAVFSPFPDFPVTIRTAPSEGAVLEFCVIEIHAPDGTDRISILRIFTGSRIAL